jgi:putative membrane protein
MFRHGMISEWWCGPGSFFPGPLGMFVTILFWGLLIYLVVKGIQFLFPGRHRGTNEEISTAETLLKNRYAGGEINREEFQQMQKDLL